MTKQTITRYAQHHPIYAERYLFNIHENSLDQITLVIAVVRKRSTNQTDSNFGSIAFGKISHWGNSFEHHLDLFFFCSGLHGSGAAQMSHWDAMLNGQGEIITRWHSLLEK